MVKTILTHEAPTPATGNQTQDETRVTKQLKAQVGYIATRQSQDIGNRLGLAGVDAV